MRTSRLLPLLGVAIIVAGLKVLGIGSVPEDELLDDPPRVLQYAEARRLAEARETLCEEAVADPEACAALKRAEYALTSALDLLGWARDAGFTEPEGAWHVYVDDLRRRE